MTPHLKVTGTPHFVLSTEGELHGEDTPHNREIVRRIHACVNACDDLSTEELERGIINDMRRLIDKIAPMFEQAEQQSTTADSPS